MSQDSDPGDRPYGGRNSDESDDNNFEEETVRRGKYRDEVYSKRVPAGKRTYFFDVKTTRSGEDYFITITESKRVDEGRYEKHKIFLYKEDFGKFVAAMHEVVHYIKSECLPDYEFRGLPEIPEPAPPDEGSSFIEGDGDY